MENKMKRLIRRANVYGDKAAAGIAPSQIALIRANSASETVTTLFALEPLSLVLSVSSPSPCGLSPVPLHLRTLAGEGLLHTGNFRLSSFFALFFKDCRLDFACSGARFSVKADSLLKAHVHSE